MTRRLLLTYLTFALLILIALEVPLGYVYHRSETQHAFGQLEHDAEVLAAFVDTALRSGQREQIDLLAHESAQRLGGDVDVVDIRGHLLASTHPDEHPAGSLATAPDIRTVLQGQGQISTRVAESGGVGIMSVAAPINPGMAAQGAVRVTVPKGPLTSRIEQFWLLLAGVGVAVLAAVALIALALARWISKPVRALELATRRLPDGALPPPATTGPPELRRLAATLRATAARMHSLLESQRSFVGHASHQLKTPLAALRLRLENLESDIPGNSHRDVQAAITETDRLAHMVETLLAMARSEQSSLSREPVVLADAVAERIYLWSPLAAEKKVRLAAAGPETTQVTAVAGAVEQIIDNLVSNALRVAPPDSTIEISWRPGPDGMVELHVVDAGPGLPAEQRERALDPFWRAPDAAKDGTGLGLSLVRKLATAGGGDVALHPADGTGIDAVVTFPAERVPA
ncbi:sensor histidine kinase [Couchioplanes azureus]|uniref:sensor histidine kinase n=1 Tax=Couchioplanes caeruleus TaxID=56438 RepID=UPI00167157AB|nr:HAMP domain-containing sensor histidine kinase [Couchioplanes caeruleus]GGQ82240.1 two-component sensor histidine kinase [Couchioplanes caeruleus subsp. azureus]